MIIIKLFFITPHYPHYPFKMAYHFKNSSYTSERKAQNEEMKKKLSNEQFNPIRGNKFKEFISSLLEKEARLPKEKLNAFLEHIDIFEQAFTHQTANPHKNYEALEIIGDTALNFCVVHYLSHRFPQLMAGDGSGVGTLSRLKINFISKEIFSQCAEKLNFADYIASNMLIRRDEYKSLLEDTFEAFQGAIIQVSELTDPNSSKKGYLVSLGPVYRIIMNFFDNISISLKYEDLYDAKTRFKQLMESKNLQYKIFFEQELNENGKIIFTSKVETFINRERFVWYGKEMKKASAEQNACEIAIAGLQKLGIQRNS